MRSRDGVVARGRSWIALALALLALKLVLASRLDLFGDEAFYRWESRHPALGYSDVPGLTPWLIRLGTDLGGSSPLGIRWAFLVIGALLPWLVYRLARLVADRRDAGRAAALSLALPLASLAGLLALPDVPLTIAMLGSLYFLARLLRREHWRHALALGLCIALGWLSHYRFAVLYVAGAVYLTLAVGGQALLRSPRFWIAQAIGLLGLVPTLAYNVRHAFAAVRFQFVERHPWSFHADGLGEVFVQAGVTTPVLFALVVAAGIESWRSSQQTAVVGRDAVRELYAAASLALLGAYLVLDCFADATHLRLHWPLPAYLFALPLVPALLDRWRGAGGWRRGLASAAAPVAALGVLLAFAWMANAARPIRDLDGEVGRYVPDHQTGWSELTAWAARERSAIGPGTVPIAGDFMTGAEWAYALGDDDEPFVIEHPLNSKHGRATQLETWGRDERALRAATWTHGLLVLDDTSVRPIQVLPFYRSLCPRFGRLDYRAELVQRAGRARFLAFAVEPGEGAAAKDRCRLPPLGYIDAPQADATLAGDVAQVRGWALAEYVGIARVEVLVDGRVATQARIGLPAPQVQGQWPMSEDPTHPNVGFEAALALAGLAKGPHALAVRLVDREGRQRIVAPQTFRRD